MISLNLGISCGEILSTTEKVLTPGISPEFLDDVIGKTLSCDVVDGAGVQFSDLL